MRTVIYNFAGVAGDLYQLVPDKFLATLCAHLNHRDCDSAQVWDRSNLRDIETLCPGTGLRTLLRKAGHRLFRGLEEKGRVARPDALLFGALSSLMERRTAGASRKLVERDAERILSSGVERVFVNLRHGPGFDDSIELAKILRRQRPALDVFAVGHRASWFGRELAELCPCFDAYVIGPSSYRTMIALASGSDPGQLPNTVFRRGGKTVATRRVFEQEDGEDVLADYRPDRYVGIEAQLPFRELVLANEACPFRCKFCIRPVTYGTRWRARDVRKVVDEIEFRVRREGIRCFRCSDSTPPPGTLTEVAKEVRRRGLHGPELHMSSFGRVNRNMREDYAELRSAGFEALFFGVESGSQRVLNDVLGKNITPAEALEAIRMAREAGLAPVASFMFPTPGETEETRQETLGLLERLKPYLAGALLQPSGVYPGTPWHTEAERYGVRVDDDYVSRAITYPIEPLKPLRFWRPFPFAYDLMGKAAPEVSFSDIVRCFDAFAKEVWGPEEHGGLGIANVQDYVVVLAGYLGVEPAALSRATLEAMVCRDTQALGRNCHLGRLHHAA